MAGGIFQTQNKIRPGFYHKFTGAPKQRTLFGDLGVAALPLVLDWGVNGDIISIDADAPREEFMEKLGRPREDIRPVHECLKRALTLLVYRVNSDGVAAYLDMQPQPVTATARYKGERGNSIEVQIANDPDDPTTYIASTYVDMIVQAEQRGISNVEDLEDNAWVVFTGMGAITAAAGGTLTGGENGTATVNDYNKFLEKLEAVDFNAFGLMDKDPVLKNMFTSATERYAKDLGKLVQCVMADHYAGYEGVTSLQNGVTLEDGTTLDKYDAVPWYVGAASAAGAAESLTYSAYDGAVGPDIRFSDAQIKAAILQGQTVFELQKDDYGQNVGVVEQDINTLIRFTKDRPQVWHKNRIVRALYILVNSLFRVWHLYYIGKVSNNAMGRTLFKADVVTMMKELVDQGAFEDFDAETDIIINRGKEADSVTAILAVRPVDAMEKMYFTVEVR